MVANFLYLNPDLNLNGMTLQAAIETSMIYEEFIKIVVLQDYADARDPIPIIAPLVLRISINSLVLDLDDNIGVTLIFFNLI